MCIRFAPKYTNINLLGLSMGQKSLIRSCLIASAEKEDKAENKGLDRENTGEGDRGMVDIAGATAVWNDAKISLEELSSLLMMISSTVLTPHP